jgi:radical SAM protein with 4Fe4S-binding SPASM domain
MVKKNVKDAAASLRLGVLPAKPSEKSCNACDFKMLCSEGCNFMPQGAGKGI